MATVAERVQRGIELLDERGPKSWREMVDLKAFDITEPCGCILGQLFGEFSDGKTVLNISSGKDFGFDANWQDAEDDYQALSAEWTRRLTEQPCSPS